VPARKTKYLPADKKYDNILFYYKEADHVTKTHFIYFLLILTISSFVVNGQNASDCGDKDYDCKIAAYNKAIAANPSDTESYYSRGIAYKNSGRRDMAIADLSKYISSKPAKPEYLADGYVARGNVYREMKNFDMAITDYTAALTANPKNQAARLNRGLSYASKKDHVSALKDYNFLIRTDPGYAEAYYDRGLVYMDQGKDDAALADFDKYVSMDLTNNEYWADGYTNRGIVRTRKGDFNGALADLSKAVALKPNDPIIYRARAKTYRKLGKTSLADADDAKAQELEAQ
jgi:tetratricopeptide (TPR) repeat protein